MRKAQPRAVLYIRVSSGPQEEHGTSLASQLAVCQSKAEQIGARIVAVEKDVQSGGDYVSRAGMQSALERIEKGEADTLVMYDMKRYSRDVEHQQSIKKRVLNAGGNLVFANLETGDLRSSGGAMIFGVSGVFAEVDRLYRREITMAGSRKRAESGIQPSRAMRPYGYHVVTQPDVMKGLYPLDQLGRYQIVESEAKWVREMFQRYATGELNSVIKVAKWLELNGVKAPRGGKTWHSPTVRRILTSGVYKGEAVWGRHQRLTDESRLERGLRSKAYIRVTNEEQWVKIEAPPLVAPDIWETCQQRIATGRTWRSGNPERRYLLTGILRCPSCGRAMRGRAEGGRGWYQAQKKKRAGEPYHIQKVYRCAYVLPSSDGLPCGYKKCFRVERIEGHVLNTLFAMAEDVRLLEAALAEKQKRRPHHGSITRRKELEKELRECHKDLEATIEAQIRAVKSGVLTDAYESRIKELEDKRRRLERDVEILKPQPEPVAQDAKAKIAALHKILQAARERLKDDDVPLHVKNAYLSEVLQSVTPLPSGGYDIVFRRDLG